MKKTKRSVSCLLCLVMLFGIAGNGAAFGVQTVTTFEDKNPWSADGEAIKDKNSETPGENIHFERLYSAYMEILKENPSGIKNDIAPRSVAILDITGDDIPELLFLSEWSEPSYSDLHGFSLSIWSYSEGKGAYCIYSDDDFADWLQGQYLFQITGQTELFSFRDGGDMNFWSVLNEYAFDVASEQLIAAHTLERQEGFYNNETGTHLDKLTFFGASMDGIDISEEDYNTRFNEIQSKEYRVILTVGFDVKSDSEYVAMTYDEAIAYLQDSISGRQVERPGESVPEVTSTAYGSIADLPSKFTFSSGAGAWETVITLNDDWSFTGQYRDGDMGDSGPGYNGTEYVCKFSGSFSVPERVNDYTYSMYLISIQSDGNPGEKYIENEVRYIYSEPYGFDNADEFLVFLSGAPTDALPTEFLVWARSSFYTGEEESIPSGYYGIYNINGKRGFVGKSEGNKESIST